MPGGDFWNAIRSLRLMSQIMAKKAPNESTNMKKVTKTHRTRLLFFL